MLFEERGLLIHCSLSSKGKYKAEMAKSSMAKRRIPIGSARIPSSLIAKAPTIKIS
jgi:hypothetical protein